MNKFGLLHEDDVLAQARTSESFAERLASFPVVAPRHSIDLAAADAAAAPHGFISREVPATVATLPPTSGSRRRRLAPVQPTRHLAIRLTAPQYDRFVAYADKHKLTYHDALARLLDNSRD
jgi:hypothetical protein